MGELPKTNTPTPMPKVREPKVKMTEKPYTIVLSDKQVEEIKTLLEAQWESHHPEWRAQPKIPVGGPKMRLYPSEVEALLASDEPLKRHLAEDLRSSRISLKGKELEIESLEEEIQIIKAALSRVHAEITSERMNTTAIRDYVEAALEIGPYERKETD